MVRTRNAGTPTLADVATLASVSPGTVSKALNGRGQLSTQTRQRVLAAAEELGFQPNLIARSLLSGRTYTVGVLTTDSIGRFTIPLLTGAEDALGAGQMSMLLCESRGDPIREQHYLRVLLARRVDGIIVTGRSSDVRPSLGRFPVPVVYALTTSDDPSDVSITHDDIGGASMAVSHLLDTGRDKIAIVTGPERHTAAHHRVDGALSALTSRGLSPAFDAPLWGDWSEEWGREAGALLQRSGHRFDGVFAASDQIARGVIDGLRESGRQIPDDVGVIGVDNWDVMVNAVRPPLSTIDLNLAQIGHRAASVLLDLIEGRSVVPGVELLPCTLVKRQSTGLVAVSAKQTLGI